MDCFKRFAESVVPKWPKLVGSSIVFVQFFLLCLEDDEENGAQLGTLRDQLDLWCHLASLLPQNMGDTV